MTSLAPHMEAFLREHLVRHRGASPHTCDSYAYSFQCLFEFASKKLKVAPSALMLEQLDAALLCTFLEHAIPPKAIASSRLHRRPSAQQGATWHPRNYEDFFAAARFSAQYFFEASMMRFLPAALSFRFGLAATTASGTDIAVFFAAHLFC